MISYEMVKEMYLKPKFISTCHAGGLFGIITADGKVFPCEILEDKVMGDLRKNEMNLMKIWKIIILIKHENILKIQNVIALMNVL